MKLIIVRHGETVSNQRGILMGQLPDHKLSELGLEQAKKVALRLKDESIDVIYSSDLERCDQTAQEIAKYHNLEIIYDKDLRERNGGIYDGIDHLKIREAVKDQDALKFVPEGGESLLAVRRRASRFLKKLNKQYKNETIVISTHGGWIRMFLHHFLNIKFNHTKVPYFNISNTGITTVEILEGMPYQIRTINCTKHL